MVWKSKHSVRPERHISLWMLRHGHTQAGEGVGAVDVHGAGTADTLTARAAEGKGRVELILDADKGVEHHGTGLVEVEGVALHARLLGRGVGVPAVDLEGLELGALLRRGLLALGSTVGKVGHAAGGEDGAESRPGGSGEDTGGRRAESGHFDGDVRY